MQRKQQQVVQELFSKLGPDANEEDNLNGCVIITDMLEIKEFYAICCKKQNIETLLSFIFADQPTPTS